MTQTSIIQAKCDRCDDTAKITDVSKPSGWSHITSKYISGAPLFKGEQYVGIDLCKECTEDFLDFVKDHYKLPPME